MPTNVANIPFGTKNPYQKMMYSACGPEFNLTTSKNVEFSEFAHPDFQEENRILHLHWDDRLFRESGEDDALKFQQVRAHLDRFKQNGGRLIWTIHNQQAHSHGDANDLFSENRRALTKMADLIHVHTPHAWAYMISEYGAESEKLRLIPHPSYLGVYEHAEVSMARPLAPRQITRFLTFGAMRGNRELERLHLAARKLTNRGHAFHVSIAGRVFRKGRRLARRLDGIANVSVIADRIPDSEIPQLFSQAHVYVLPSTTTFTSGTAMLAQTFGLPIIGPDIEAHKQTTPEACHDLLYPAQNPRGLIRMMMRMMEMSDAELNEKRLACFEFAVQRDPMRVSGLLKNALSELV